MTLKEEYAAQRERILVPLAIRIQRHLEELLAGLPRIDAIRARAKAVDRFLAKAGRIVDGSLKYQDPLSQIQDQLGARIITFYLNDVDTIAEHIEKHYRKIEKQTIIPDSTSEFGYIGRHYVLFVPSELFDATVPSMKAPQFFELQIKTLFQHAWAEANHDLAYKPTEGLSVDQRRKVAFTAAQSWGADTIFEELYQDLSTSLR